jgi:DNA-binding NarL/FixJ family response regulator
MPAPTDRITVVIVDDHTLFRVGLREVFHDQDDIEVVGEAGDGATAVKLVAELRPAILLLDVSLPGEDVTVTVRAVRAVSPGTRVVIVSMQDEPRLIQELVALGARGYLLKSASWSELMAAVRMAHTSSTRVLLSISAGSVAGMRGPARDGRPPIAALSAREIEVLRLASGALSNAQIAGQLHLTEATVKRHLHSIFTKLGAVSRIDAVSKAISASLIPSWTDE